MNAEFFSAGLLYLNLVNAEILVVAFFFVLLGWNALYLAADINTTYSMGTAPFMLPISLLLVPPLHYRDVKFCPNFRRWCRRYAVDFSAVGAAFLRYREVKRCPNFRRSCRR